MSCTQDVHGVVADAHDSGGLHEEAARRQFAEAISGLCLSSHTAARTTDRTTCEPVGGGRGVADVDALAALIDEGKVHGLLDGALSTPMIATFFEVLGHGAHALAQARGTWDDAQRSLLIEMALRAFGPLEVPSTPTSATAANCTPEV